MALIDSGYNTPPDFDIQATQGGNPAEMELHLNTLIASSAQTISDIQLAGAGAGPMWEAWLVRGDSSTPTVDPTAAVVAASVAGNPVQAVLQLNQRLAAINAVTAINSVNKVVVAGGGVGPTYMAVALATLVVIT